MQPYSATDATRRPDQAADLGTDEALGRTFAEALSRKDFDALLALLDPEIDFRGLTPGRAWDALGPRAVVEDVLRQWFEDTDKFDEIDLIPPRRVRR